MAGHRPPKPPSALDGYRRLERTRSAAGAISGAAVIAEVPPREAAARAPRVTKARVAGALRLLGFVGVLALIVGTSVSIASADERPSVERPTPTAGASRDAAAKAAPTAVAPKVSEPALREAPDAKADAAPADAAAVDVAASEPIAAPAPASTTAPARDLPFTGEAEVRWFVLGGALFVLTGMLVQIAGQPLPARARTASRA